MTFLLPVLLVMAFSNITEGAHQQDIPEDWISLFNGKDLSGWKVHGTEKWYVEDGDLVCESGPEEK